MNNYCFTILYLFLLYFIYIGHYLVIKIFEMKVNLRRNKLLKGRECLYLDYRHNGRRVREFLKLYLEAKNPNNKEVLLLAEKIRAQKELDLLNGENGFVSPKRKKANFTEFYRDYTKQYKKQNYRVVLNSFAKFILFLEASEETTNIGANQIDKSFCIDFKDYLVKDAGLSGETPQNYFTQFKKVLEKGVDKGLFKSNPSKDVSIKRKNDIAKQVLTKEELTILKNTYCGNTEVKRAFLFACYTGMGVAEITVLKWTNIQNGKVQFERGKTKVKVHNKLPKSALAILKEQKENSEGDYIFKLPSSVAIGKNLTNWMQKAEITKHISFYCARHTFAVLLLSNGVDLLTVSKTMGHKSTQYTVRYLNFVDHLKDEAMDNMPEI